MKFDTKTILILAAIGIVGYVVWKKYSGTANRVAATTNSGSTGNNAGKASGTTSGSADFWGTLGNVGQGLNSATSSVESTYNGIYDLFGSAPTTASGGSGNNGTAG